MSAQGRQQNHGSCGVLAAELVRPEGAALVYGGENRLAADISIAAACNAGGKEILCRQLLIVGQRPTISSHKNCGGGICRRLRR